MISWDSTELKKKNQTILWRSRTHRADGVLLNHSSSAGGVRGVTGSDQPSFLDSTKGLRIECLNGSAMIMGFQLTTPQGFISQ